MLIRKFAYLTIMVTLLFNTILFGQNHFQTIWTSPYQAMNIYITSATLNTNNMAAGDEIAIFDGNICVSVKVLTDQISLTNPLSLIASKDDPTTSEIDGFTEDHILTFKAWNANNLAEYSNFTSNYTTGYSGIFQALGTTVLELSFDATSPVQKYTEAIISQFILEQNYPNPFNPITTISYYLPISSWVKLTVFNLNGEEIKILQNNEIISGYHAITWNGKNSKEIDVPSGVYFYQLKTQENTITKKLLLIK